MYRLNNEHDVIQYNELDSATAFHFGVHLQVLKSHVIETQLS